MRTILVLVSIWMLVSLIDASNPTASALKKGTEIFKVAGSKIRVRKFRTTTTSTSTTEIPLLSTAVLTTTTTTEEPTTTIIVPTTITTTPTSTTPLLPPIFEAKKNTANKSEKELIQNETGKRSQRGLKSYYGDISIASNINNIIDLGEQDIENLDLTKLYDRDSSKDDPNVPTVLQFIAPSSTSFMDPNYISKLIQQQLGEGYQYTNYTITPGSISSEYTAPFPKEGFSLPPAPKPMPLDFNLGGPSTGVEISSEPEVRPTKHEFPNAPLNDLPTKNFNSSPTGFNSPVAPASDHDGLNSGSKAHNLPPGYRILSPIFVTHSPNPSSDHNSPITSPTVYSSLSHPVFTSPSPPTLFSSSIPAPIYSSHSPTQVYSLPNPTAPSSNFVYSSPNSLQASGYSSPTQEPSGYTFAPRPSTGFSSPTQATYSSPTASSTPEQKYVQSSNPSGSGYSTSNTDNSASGSPASEYLAPPIKDATSEWNNYARISNSKDLPPVKVSFPSESSKEPEYLPPSDGYSTMSEKLVAPGITPGVTGGYNIQEETKNQEYASPGKYFVQEYNSQDTDTGYQQQSSGAPESDESETPTIIHHQHHYVNYLANDVAQPPELYGTPNFFRTAKNIFESLGGTSNYLPSTESGPSVIYGKPAPSSFRPPSFIRFPSESYNSIPNFESPQHTNYEPSARPADTYGTPPTQYYDLHQVAPYSSPSPPSSHYGNNPYPPSSNYGPSPSPPSPTYGPSPSPPSPTYGPVPSSNYGPSPSLPSSHYGNIPYPPSSNYGPSPSPPSPTYDPPLSSNYGPPEVEQPENTPQEHPKIFKTIYVNLPPEEPTEKPKPVKPRVPIAPQRHYKIIFIKAPTPPPPEEPEIELPPPAEHKTFIYVLSKTPDPQPPIKIATPPPTEPSKPEVHFIQYKDEKKNTVDQNKIQKPNGDYGLPNESPGTPLGLSDMGYDVSSSESKVEVQVTKSVSSTK